MRTSSIVPHDAERDTYLVLDDFGDRLGRAWRETDAESADRATLIRNLLDVPWRANVRQHTEQGAAEYGLRYRPGGDHRAHGFRSTASTPLNEDGAFHGHVVEPNSPTTRRKKRRRRDEMARLAWQGRQ
jgi:hypothetical protein